MNTTRISITEKNTREIVRDNKLLGLIRKFNKQSMFLSGQTTSWDFDHYALLYTSGGIERFKTYTEARDAALQM
jgi:hypothetical protein